MRQIRIEGVHPAYTSSQLRAATIWVLRQLEIPADASGKWTVALGVSRRGYSGQGGGGCTILRFTTRPLPAEARARDLVHLLAHELWHNEQHRHNGWRWPRTATGKRKNMEPGARVAAAGVDAAFRAQEDLLLARWGFERGALLPAPKAEAPVALATLAAIEAAMAERQRIGDEIHRHIGTHSCPTDCPEFDALRAQMAEASKAWWAAKQRAVDERAAPARAAGLVKAKAVQAQKAARRERAVRAKLAEWERKAKAAAAKVREYRAKVRYYDRKDARLAAASRSPETGAPGPAAAPVATPAPGPDNGALRGAEEFQR
jgi:hypothetical protein